MGALVFLITVFLTGASVSSGAPVENSGSVHPDTVVATDSRILELIRIVNSREDRKSKHEPDSISKASELDVLDYLSAICADNDYYESGDWGIGGEIAVPVLYSGILPEYVVRDFCRPVSGRVTSAFGLRQDVRRMHKGIDLSLSIGDSVKVALDGVVERTGFDKNGFGHFVVVKHPEGIQTIYAHLQRSLVATGENVSAGGIIGLGGKSGNSTGPHLHFEVRFWGQIVDPTFLVSRGGV